MKKLYLLIITIAILLSLCACSSVGSAKNYDANEDNYVSSSQYSTERQIIENVSLSLQTKAYDEFIINTEAKIKELGGYVANSSADGDNADNTSNRYARYEVKIPDAKSKEFIDFVSRSATIYSKSISTEDVTSKYIDIESRLSALEAEKSKLQELAAKADNLNEIIEIQKYLTDVIYEIESYQTQLKSLNEQTEYTTVYLYINEVDRITKSTDDNIWQQIWDNLCNGVKNVWTILKKLFVFTISTIPYMLIPGVIALTIVLIIKAKRKKRNK